MRIFFLTVLSLILILTILSCDDDKWERDFDIMYITQFPNEIGTQYAYQIYDSLNTTFDTLIVTIKDSISFTDSGYFKIWEYDYGDTAETMFVNIVDDTLSFYRMDSLQIVTDFQIVFPLKLGKTWKITGSGWPIDSCQVTELDPFDYWEIMNSVNTPPAIPQSFRIDRDQYSFNDVGFESYWVHPGIGIVKKLDQERLFVSSKNEVWDLISLNRNDSLTFQQFPVPLGAQWVYDYSGPNIDFVEEVVVSIFDSTATMEDHYFLMYNHFMNQNNYRLSASINPIEQTMRIQWSAYTFLDLDFPLYVGKKWANHEGYDTTRVTKTATVETPLGTFDNAFVLQSKATGFETLIEFTYWVVPNIGMVKYEQVLTDLITNNTYHSSYFLKSYMVLKPASVFTLNKFEFSLGSYWKYLVHNGLIDCGSGFDCIDTMTVTIAGYKIANDTDIVTVWEYEYLDQIDTEYTYTRPDTMFVARYTDPLFPYRGYKFPITIGDGWSAMMYNDTSNVLGLENVTTNSYSFENCTRIETGIWCGDECGHVENEWLVPNIGVVKKTIYESEYDIFTGSLMVKIDQGWELIDYYHANNPIDCTKAASVYENIRY